MSFCSNCGASVDGGAAFCSGCGRSLSEHSSKPRGFWAGVGAAVLGVVVLGGLLWATAGSNSANRSQNGLDSASETEAAEAGGAMPAHAAAPGEAEPDVIVEEPGFVGKLLGEKPRVILNVSKGQTLDLELRTAISTETASAGDTFTAVLVSPVLVEGHEALPAGTEVTGHVAHAERSDKVKGLANLTLELDEIAGPDENHLVKAEVLRFEARPTTKDDAVKIGGASGAGAIVGAIIGGKKGAAIGAGVGAGAGTGVVLSTRGEEVVLPQGAKLTTRLESSFKVELPEEDDETPSEGDSP